MSTDFHFAPLQRTQYTRTKRRFILKIQNKWNLFIKMHKVLNQHHSSEADIVYEIVFVERLMYFQ